MCGGSVCLQTQPRWVFLKMDLTNLREACAASFQWKSPQVYVIKLEVKWINGLKAITYCSQ